MPRLTPKKRCRIDSAFCMNVYFGFCSGFLSNNYIEKMSRSVIPNNFISSL
jgi:hypothetical protein